MSLSWQVGAGVAALLVILSFVPWPLGSGRDTVVAALRECAILFGLYALWQLVLDFTVTSTTGALAHARWVWHAERVVHLPSEAALQRFVLSERLLVTAGNDYYRALHYGFLITCLAWVFFFHRDRYHWCRRILVLATAVTIPIQIPVAPPRMLSGLGLVDTANLHSPETVLAGLHDPGQVTAMPSVHVLWALLVAVFVIHTSTRPWRWLAVAYPVMTLLVVAWTGNHFWADGLVSGVLLALVLVADQALRRRAIRPGS